MLRARKLALALMLAVALPAAASDLAVLRNGFSIACQRREEIGSITRLYVKSGDSGYLDVPTAMIDHFAPDPAPPAASVVPAAKASPAKASSSGSSLDLLVTNAGANHHLDPDLINSVIHAESGFNPRAVSPKGAQGLMQLMPQTASRLGVANSFDPKANVEGGTSYLRMLLERYNFDIIKALAAYNAGPQRVEQYRGVPPYHETQAYVARIIRDFNRKKLAERKAAAKNAHSTTSARVQAASVSKLTRHAAQ